MSTDIPESTFYDVAVESGVATVWLNRPGKLNALNMAAWDGLPEIMERLGAIDDVRAAVIAGRGRAFSAGLDLAEMIPHLGNGSTVAGRRALLALIKKLQRAFSSIAGCPKPVIAAVHGHCIGGGVDLVAACDIRLASADAVFSVRETKLAMVADLGTLQRLPRLINAGRAAELVYTGRNFGAEEAAEMGLVSHVYADRDALLKHAGEMARDIAANSPLAVQGAKAVLRAGESQTVEEGLDYVALWNAAFFHSDDLQEAIRAHVENRPPEFEGN